MDPSSILRNDLPMYLKKNPQTCFVEMLCYGRSPFAYHEKVKAKLMTGLSEVIQAVDIEVFQGEEWNHSTYQADQPSQTQLPSLPMTCP